MSSAQSFSHTLSSARNWDKTLAALHALLLKKWYYLGIASNTQKGSSASVVKGGIDFSRRRSDIREPVTKLLGVSSVQFKSIQLAVAKQKSHGDADLWHLPSGKVGNSQGIYLIELRQKPMLAGLLGGKAHVAYLLIDPKATAQDHKNAMLLFTKVLKDKKYAVEALSKGKSEGAKQRTQALDTRGARQPAGLMIALKNRFSEVAPTLTEHEIKLLQNYGSNLESKGQLRPDLKAILQKLSSH